MTNLRILPLLSSATEIVHALGIGAYQVGRSHECDFPKSVLNLPVCTRPVIEITGSSADIDRQVKERAKSALSIYEVDAELIATLRPTHIITQTQCKVCAVSLDDVEQALRGSLGADAKVIALEPYELNDLWSDIRRIASACDVADKGERLIASLNSRIVEVQARAKTAHTRPSVAALEWLDPLMAGGNWVPELIELAGGVNLFGVAGQHSPWMARGDLIAADPDVVVAIPCGFDLERTRTEAEALATHPAWQSLTAVRTGNVFICDGNQYMNRPGPRLVESLQIFAEILHPELFPPTLEGSGWERLLYASATPELSNSLQLHSQ